VQLSVEPQITQLGEIRLDISDLQLNDYVGSAGNEARIDVDGNGGLDSFEPVAIATAVLGNERRTRSIQTVARCSDGGTIVLGGWEGESSRESESGVPILRMIPYIGKIFFNRTSDRVGKSSLLVFLTCNIVKP
jgi:general secretion pathway protein D